MFARFVCACALLTSEASALQYITTDTTLDALSLDPITVVVSQDATLTIVPGPAGELPQTREVILSGNAHLRMNTGTMLFLHFDPLPGCDGINICDPVHQTATLDNVNFLSVFLFGDNTIDLHLIDSKFSTLPLQNRNHHITLEYTDAYRQTSTGMISGRPEGRYAFTAPGADYSVLNEDHFLLHMKNSAGDILTPAKFVPATFPAVSYGYLTIVPTDAIPGDANRDGAVDLADFNAVRNNFDRPLIDGTTSLGDTAPYDGAVDLEDLNRMRNNFGLSAANPIPEPPSIALLIMALGSIAGNALLRKCHRSPCYFGRSL